MMPFPFSQYEAPSGESAFFKKIPIELLDEFRSHYNYVFRIRYRGPRKHRNTPYYNRSGHCLKCDATTFSAYSK
jgi:hypothetical protein